MRWDSIIIVAAILGSPAAAEDAGFEPPVTQPQAAERTDAAQKAPAPVRPPAPQFMQAERAVSTWRTEAADHLALTPERAVEMRDGKDAPTVARCVKLNNYWCIKKAGWDGEIAADSEGHVAFASALEGAAVAALLLKRYYVDFDRKNAKAIISRWAPAQCGFLSDSVPRGRGRSAKASAPIGLGNTLRARWLASHSRGFVTPVAGRGKPVRRSVVADRVSKMLPTPIIAAGLSVSDKPMTLDALLLSSPNAPPSRSMLGMPRSGGGTVGTVSACGTDTGRIASYAQKAAAGIEIGPGGDLQLFASDGTPTPNLAVMMANMARVEIGPYDANPELIEAGIAQAFNAGRNPAKP